MRLLFGILTMLIISISACKKDDPIVEEDVLRTSIAPAATDNAYDSDEDGHLVLFNKSLSKNELLLFIGGTYSKPTSYEKFCNHAADDGFHVISISYPNNIAAASLKESDDLFVFDNYRDELCYGNAVSDAVSVDELNAIVTRFTKLLIYLSANFPDQNWGQYLVDGNAPNWNKIIIAGHSQGAGHASYIAKSNMVSRVLMFSGPNDYSTHFAAPANWLSTPGVTASASHYVFLHVHDEVVPYDYQLDNIRAIGVIDVDDTTTLMDDLNGSYDHKHAFHTEISAITEHGSTLGSNWRLPNFWSYLLNGN